MKQIVFRSFVVNRIHFYVELPSLKELVLEGGALKKITKCLIQKVPFQNGIVRTEKESLLLLQPDEIHCDSESTLLGMQICKEAMKRII